jgi:hypothetical protein
MKEHHVHCTCEEDYSDWRRGRYEPAEAPEPERLVVAALVRGSAGPICGQFGHPLVNDFFRESFSTSEGKCGILVQVHSVSLRKRIWFAPSASPESVEWTIHL